MTGMRINGRTRSSADERKRRASTVGVAAAVAIAMGSTTGHAQNQERASGLEEVVVTARYREENIQTTPIAISAFSGAELEMRSLDNVEDIGVVIPNAFMRESVGNYGPTGTIGLRGLSQNDFSYAFEPAVGVYIDDIYHGTLSGSAMDLIDLERLEVLRGPQGTLFGKSSLGGSMRLISTKPQGDNTGQVQITFGEFDRLDVKAMGDIELTDKLFARLVGVTKRRDGYGERLDFTCEMIRRGTPELAGIGDGIGGWIPDPQGPGATAPPGPPGTPGAVYDPDNTNPAAGGRGEPIFVEVGSDADNAFSFPAARDLLQRDNCSLGSLGGEQSEAGRVMLRFLPTDRLEANFSADFSSSSDDPTVETQLTPVIATPTSADQRYENGMILPNYGIPYINTDRWITGDPYTNYSTHADPFDGQTYPTKATMEAWGASAVVDYDLGDRTHMKFITGYRTYESEWNSDTDRTPFPIQGTHYLQEHEQVQVEVQFTGNVLNDRLEWTTGLFYYDSESRAYNTTEFGVFDFGPGGPGTGTLPNFIADDEFTTESKSLFAHAAYSVTDRLAVSGGVRSTSEDKTNTFAHYGQFVIEDPLLFGDDRTDWKLSVDFSLTENIFLYAQGATGFRSEGATPRIFTVGQLGVVPAEEVLTTEIGAKTEFLDQRVRLNAAIFRSDYDPRAIQTFGLVNQCDSPTDPNPTPYFLSGGNCPDGTFFAGGGGLPWFYYANSPGVLEGYEVEITASPIDNMSLNYSLGHTEYSNDNQDPTSPLFLHPSWLLQPEYNMSFGVQYAVQLGNGGTLTPRLDAFYQSHRTNGGSTIQNTCPEQCIPSYTVLNARVTYDAPNDWRVSLAATNLTDEFYWQQLGAAVTNTGAIASNRSGVASRPREWALSLEKHF